MFNKTKRLNRKVARLFYTLNIGKRTESQRETKKLCMSIMIFAYHNIFRFDFNGRFLIRKTEKSFIKTDFKVISGKKTSAYGEKIQAELKKQGKFMEKIEIKDNPLKLEIYINGKPNLSLMPKELKDAFINSLTERVLEYVRNKKSKKQ